MKFFDFFKPMKAEPELRPEVFEVPIEVNRQDLLKQREQSFLNLIEIVSEGVGADEAYLFLYEPLKNQFLLKTQKTEAPIDVGAKFEAQGVFLALLKEKKILNIQGAQAQLFFSTDPEPTRAVWAVPLMDGRIFRGALVLGFKEPKPFYPKTQEMLKRFAMEFVQTLRMIESQDHFFKLEQEITLFMEAGSKLSLCVRPNEVYETLWVNSKLIAQCEEHWVVLSKNETQEMVFASGAKGEKLCGRVFQKNPQSGLVAWSQEHQQPLYFDKFNDRSLKTPLLGENENLEHGYNSVLILPLISHNKIVGASVLFKKQKYGFNRHERKMLEVLHQQAAITLQNANLFLTMETLATTDGLTNLMNHRTFQETLSLEMDRSQRQNTVFSLLLIDIDHFKSFNDRYGHTTGDFVLKKVSDFLKENIRKVDHVARYGGEEFAAILVGTDPKNAKIFADRLVAQLARTPFFHDKLKLSITCSVGVASYPGFVSERKLIEAADAALYASKNKGRNQATLYEKSIQVADFKGESLPPSPRRVMERTAVK